MKQIVVAELQPDETVDAVREARLLAKVDYIHVRVMMSCDVKASSLL